VFGRLTRKKLIGMGAIVAAILLTLAWVNSKISGLLGAM
jgi:hypothetical protein